MSGMYGTYKHTLDAKGRISIPSRLRDELGEEFFVTLSPEKCLTAYSLESWAKILEKVGTMSKINQKKARFLFSHAENCKLDAQGRILLPLPLREFVGLKKNVTVVGAGECAQFWDSEAWAVIDAEETLPENIESVFEELGI